MGVTEVVTARTPARQESVSDRALLGRAAGEPTPRSSHAGSTPAVDRARNAADFERLHEAIRHGRLVAAEAP